MNPVISERRRNNSFFLNSLQLPEAVQVPVSQRMLEKYGKEITLCPKCSKGKLVWICTTYPTTDKLIFSKSKNGAKQDEKTKP